MRLLPLLLVFALLLPLPVLAQSTETAGLLLAVSDPSTDVVLSVNGQSSPGLPGNSLADSMDITQVHIQDVDEESLVIRVTTKAPFVRLTDSGSYFGFATTQVFHQILFNVPGQGGVNVPAIVQLESIVIVDPSRSGVFLIYSVLCFPGRPNQQACDHFENRYVQTEVVDGAAVVTVPKTLFLRSEQGSVTSRSAALPLRLLAGAQFTDVYARSISGSRFDFTPLGGTSASPRLYDRAPDTGMHSFQLLHPSPTTDVRIGTLSQSLVAGEENLLALEVVNLGSNRRIINFSAEVLYQSDDGDWRVEITPSVTLASGKGTNLTVRVQPPALGSDLSAYARVRIRANVLTEPGTVALSYAGFSAQPPLDAKQSTFFLHGATYRPWDVPLPFFAWGWGMFSRHQEMPGVDDGPIRFNGGFSFVGGSTLFSHVWSEGVPNPALFLRGQPIVGHIDLESDLPATGTLRTTMTAGDLLLVDSSKSVNLQRGKNSIDQEFPPPLAQRITPQNGSLRVVYSLQLNAPEGTLIGAGAAGVSILPKTTWFKLPVEREFPLLVARPNFQVALVGTEDLTGFVNPGRTTVYELELRNEHDRRLSLAVAAENVTEGWSVKILPSARFRLGPNDSVQLGVVVTAPSNAAEGATSVLRVMAREVETEEAVAGVSLRTLVTSGVEIENETFEMRAEDSAKLESAPGGGASPGIGWAAASAMLGTLALLLRRRRYG